MGVEAPADLGGVGLGTLRSERVSLRAVCSTRSCPPLSWALSAAPAAPSSRSAPAAAAAAAADRALGRALLLESRGRRFVISPPALEEHSYYYVNLRGDSAGKRPSPPPTTLDIS